MSIRYADCEYWDARYKREPGLFEWFFGHNALRRIIRTYFSKKRPVLHVGCGTSNLQEGMAKSGYNIINTDISQVVIDHMRERHQQYSNMTYVVSDCRNMPEFMDYQFGSVLDKGTVDALLCCKQGAENVLKMLLEICRVLQPGGVFLLITLGNPGQRLPLLLNSRLGWKVSLLLLPKIPADCQAYVDDKPVNDSIRPVEPQGPFEVVSESNIVGMPPEVQYSNYFFAYVCKKTPLQLPDGPGQKGRLPVGWVEGSRELFQKLQKELDLPEDLFSKGRRSRVIHVPVGAGSAAASLRHSLSLTSGGSGSRRNSYTAIGAGEQATAAAAAVAAEADVVAAAAAIAAASTESEQWQMQLQDQDEPGKDRKLEEASDAGQQHRLQQRQEMVQQQVSVAALQQVQGQHAGVARIKSAPNLAGLAENAAGSGDTVEPRSTASACLPHVMETALNNQLATLNNAPPPAAAAVQATAGEALRHLSPAAESEAVPHAAAGVPASPGLGNSKSPSDCDILVFDSQGLAQAFETQSASAAVGQLGGGRQLCAVLEEESGPLNTAGSSDRPASAEPDCSSMYENISSRCTGRTMPADRMTPAAAAAGLAPVCSASRAPRVRRFSTESAMYSTLQQQQHLALLRQQQAQHSERAMDGLILHDVSAVEACGGGAAAAAATAALATAVWSQGRPPRSRRLSALSIVSNASILSSSISECTLEDEYGGSTEGSAAVSGCSSAGVGSEAAPGCAGDSEAVVGKAADVMGDRNGQPVAAAPVVQG